MKFIILLAAFYTAPFSVNAQSLRLTGKTTIYLVRHAEKEKGNDPGLTTTGKQRAGDLMRLLKNSHLQRIYVTQFRRTQMTADSLRIQLGIDTVHYLADTTSNDLLEKIKEHHDFGKTILIIGHSNTVPVIIKRSGVLKRPADIPDNEFDNLFIVKKVNGKAMLTIKKYGAKARKTASIETMQPLQ